MSATKKIKVEASKKPKKGTKKTMKKSKVDLSSSDSEFKFFDTAISFFADTTAEVPTTGQLNLIPQGVTESTRVGRKCVLKSIQFAGGFFYVPGANATGAALMTLWLILDKQANGAAAAVTDVFTSAQAFSALRNLSNSDRFVVIKKWKVPFNSSAGVSTAYNNHYVPWEYYKRINIPIEFSSTTGAITEIKSNNLFLICGSDGTSDDLVSVTATCRLRFQDN